MKSLKNPVIKGLGEGFTLPAVCRLGFYSLRALCRLVVWGMGYGYRSLQHGGGGGDEMTTTKKEKMMMVMVVVMIMTIKKMTMTMTSRVKLAWSVQQTVRIDPNVFRVALLTSSCA